MIQEEVKKPGFDYIELREGVDGSGNAVFQVQSKRTGGRGDVESFKTAGEARNWIKAMNSASYANGQMKAQNAISEKMKNAGIENSRAGIDLDDLPSVAKHQGWDIVAHAGKFYAYHETGGRYDEEGPFASIAATKNWINKQ